MKEREGRKGIFVDGDGRLSQNPFLLMVHFSEKAAQTSVMVTYSFPQLPFSVTVSLSALTLTRDTVVYLLNFVMQFARVFTFFLSFTLLPTLAHLHSS